MNDLRWPAPAKINLFLHVVGARADGYHELQTLFQFLDFGDELRFEIRPDGRIAQTKPLPGIAVAEDLNLRAARLLQKHSGCSMGVDITVTKRIPVGGGLGGGSSNAATVLVALNALWDIGLSLEELAEIGLQLGADVPVFVRGHCAWAEGVGERLTPMEAAETPVLVVCPGVAVATAVVFRAPDLTHHTPPIRIQGFSMAQTRNDCEPVARRLFPEVGAVLDFLAAHAPARMSGTGACCFALCESREEAQALAAVVPARWSSFVAERRNHSPLHEMAARVERIEL